MKNYKRIAALALAGAVAVFGLAACGSSDQNAATPETSGAQVQTEAADDGEDLGFTEVEIFSGVEREFLNLNAVYFQPVDMTGGYNAEDYDCHLELDVSALANGFGYGTGDWVPYLTVEYEVSKNDGSFTDSGTFMPMAASDGPHYGNNIALAEGEYTITLSIKSPAENGYLLHVDDETGVDAKDGFWTEPLEATWTGWKFVKEW